MIVAIMTTALSGTAWAEDAVFYTLDGTVAATGNAYATATELTQNGIGWSVVGNTEMTPWRIGGKSITGVDRDIKSTTAMGSAITKVEVSVGNTGGSLTVNSIKLIVASDNGFTTVLDEITKTSDLTSTTLTFTPTSGTEWATNAYYKIVFNVTRTGSSGNGYVQFNSAQFYYDNSGSSVKPNPTINVSGPEDLSGNALNTLYVNEDFYLTVTTTSDAAITYDSNEDELYVSSWNSTTGKMCLIPHVAGSVSITYSVAETDNYAEASKTETFTIVKRPTTCEIVVPDGFNDNIANGNTAGKLKGQLQGMTAVYNSQSDNPTTASLFTWTSSNTDVATIASDGTVTLVGAGTTTITCNFAGDDTYAASSATNVLTVINGVYVQPTTVEVNLNNSLFGTNYNGSVTGLSDENALSGTIDNVTVTYGGGGNHYVNNSQIRFYPSNKLTFEAPAGYEITQIVFTADGTWTTTITADSGTYTDNTKTWTGSATSVLFTGSGSSVQCRMSQATVTLVQQGVTPTYTLSWTAGANTELFVFDAADETTPLTTGVAVTAGTTINVSVDVTSEYELDELIVKDASNNDVALTEITAGSYYSFEMPASNVTITSSAVASSVTPTGGATVTFDFSDTAWGFPANYDLDEKNYTCDGYTFTVGAVSSGGHKALTSTASGGVTNQVGLIFGKVEGATLTFPAFPFNVSKIVVNGPASGASGKVTQNIFVGNVAVSTETTGANGTLTYDIDENYQDAGNVYVLKLTNGNNTQICSIEVFGYESVTVTNAGYATYCSENALDFTNTDIKAYVGTKKGDKLTFTSIDHVPTNTGMLLVYAGGKTENVPVIASAPELTITNCLVGVNVETTISSTDYILNKVNDGVGFYKAGSWTTLGAHKAYIPAAAVGNGVKGFTIDFDDDATGISLMEDGRSQMEDGVIYNLAGQRISKMQKGINIVNGKKILR